MDNSASEAMSWTTPAPALIAAAAGGVVMAVVAIMSPDAASRLLTGLAAAALLALAGLGFRQRPRLTVCAGPKPRLIVRSLAGPTQYSPEQILRARTVPYRRLGRKTPMLEIDVQQAGTERLLIFGRWDLGTDPDEVYQRLADTLGLTEDPRQP